MHVVATNVAPLQESALPSTGHTLILIFGRIIREYSLFVFVAKVTNITLKVFLPPVGAFPKIKWTILENMLAIHF
jgi:hypothetical protein